MSDLRPVWPTVQQMRLLRVLAKDYADIEALVEAWDAAPKDLAGPHGAIRVAITNAYYDARNAGETMETAADNARDAVLSALGYPGCPSQETPT